MIRRRRALGVVPEQGKERRRDFSIAARTMAADPGEWFVIAPAERTTRLADVVNTGLPPFDPPGTYQATTHANTDGTVSILARAYPRKARP